MSDSQPEGALPACPKCAEQYTYEAGALLVCPMCGHEWVLAEETTGGASEGDEGAILDAVGNVLSDGDTVTVTKTVKIGGGGGQSVKAGTKVTGIRLNFSGRDGHDIDAKIPGIGKLALKSSIVKRVG